VTSYTHILESEYCKARDLFQESRRFETAYNYNFSVGTFNYAF